MAYPAGPSKASTLPENMPGKESICKNSGFSVCVGVLIIVVCTAAVFSPVVRQSFFNWDDPKHVKAIWKPSWERAWRIVSDLKLNQTDVAYYIPLHFLSLMADQALLSGADQPHAWISKLVNLAYHAVNASLLFIILVSIGTGLRAALLGALVFALHPIQVGTVAWVAERKNVLSAFFYLSSLAVFLSFLRNERLACAFVVLALFVAGLLSKPSCVTMPVVMLAWMAISHRLKDCTWRALALVGLTMILAMVWGLYVVSTEVSYPGILPPWYMRPLLVAAVVWFYLAKFVYPHDLVVVYPRWDIEAGLWDFLPLLVGLVMAGTAIIWFRRRMDNVLILGICFFSINVLPVSGLVPFGHMGHSFVADHLAYLPLAGLSMVVASAANSALSALRPRVVTSHIFQTAALGLLCVLAFLSARQLRLWNDPALLWEAALSINKGSPAVYLNYGALCATRGDLEKALSLFRRASELAPSMEISYNNMGKILLSLGRREQARQMFEKSLAANPAGVIPRLMLGRMLIQDNKPREALDFFTKSVESEPGNPSLRVEFADTYRRLGQDEKALKELDIAIELAPLSADPYVAKAHIVMSRGQEDKAVGILRKALSLGSNPDAHNMLGVVLAQKGNAHEALDEFLKAYRLKPDLEGVRDNVANAMMDMGDFGRAREFCSSALKLGLPCSTEVLKRLDRGPMSRNRGRQ